MSVVTVPDLEPKARKDTLSIIDNRTGQIHDIAIKNNSILAADFKQTGIGLYDPGLRNTACINSKICYVNGETGEIAYRGYRLEDLYSFDLPYEHVAFLLLYGHLPSPEEVAQFNSTIASTDMPPPTVMNTIKSLPKNVHPPMAIAGALTIYASTKRHKIPAYMAQNLYQGNLQAIDRELPQVLFVNTVLTAAVYCHLYDREFKAPKAHYSFMENWAYMMRFVDAKGEPDKKIIGLLSRAHTLMADHEINNSTAAMLTAASSLTDPYSGSVVADLAGFGALHGGAIEAVYKQLEAVGSVKNVPAFIEDVKNGKQRLFGYGHTKWKYRDPRQPLMRLLLEEAVRDIPQDALDKTLAVALEVDHIASQDEYFKSRNLVANADMYLSLLYVAIGVHKDFTLAMILVGRNPGYMAHWREAVAASKPLLWRPLQVYTGNRPQRAEAEAQMVFSSRL